MPKKEIAHYFQTTFPVIDFHQDFILREQQLSDAKDFLEYYNVPEVSKFILAEIPNTLSTAENEIEFCRSLYYKHTGIYWSLAVKSTNKMIGAIGFYVKTTDEIEICYDLHKNYWGQGIMTTALREVIQFGRHEIKFKNFSAITLKQNLSSTHLLLKLGFHHEKTLHQHRYFNGQFHDVERYRLKF